MEPIYLEDLARPNECTLELSVRLPFCNCFLLPIIRAHSRSAAHAYLDLQLPEA